MSFLTSRITYYLTIVASHNSTRRYCLLPVGVKAGFGDFAPIVLVGWGTVAYDTGDYIENGENHERDEGEEQQIVEVVEVRWNLLVRIVAAPSATSWPVG